MKKILIALDFDPTAEKIAETGYALGKCMNAEVILLHVVAEPAYYSSPEFQPVMGFTGFLDFSGPDIEAINEQLRQESKRYLETSKAHLGDDSIRTLIAEGSFAEGILQTAETEGADIIVIGKRTRSALDKLLLGSVAEKILHNSKVPVFVIPMAKEK